MRLLYKETVFEESRIGSIPKDWKALSLEDTADFVNGYGFSPSEWNREGLPIIRIQNLNDRSKNFNRFQGEIERRYVVEDSDLLFSWSGSVGAYIWRGEKAVLNQHIFKVIPKETVDKMYLFYVLNLAIQSLENKVHGSTMKHFRRGELVTTFIPVPPLGEQKRIVKIIQTLDLGIQQTDEIIAKSQRLRQGLMQELLARGFGHSSFEESEMGEIPPNWNFARLGDLVTNVRYGTSHKANSDGLGSPVLGIPNIIRGEIDDANLRHVELSETETKPLALKDGDILIVRTNANPEYIGRCALFEKRSGTWLYASYLIRIRPKTDEIQPSFLTKYLQSENARKEFVRMARSSAGNYNINTQNLNSILIRVPPQDEQSKIVGLLSAADFDLDCKRKQRRNLERIKMGFMDLLLMGKVRIAEN